MRRNSIPVSIFVIACMFWCSLDSAEAQCPALPYQLTNGQAADATQVMADFNALIACINTKGTVSSVGIASPGGTVSVSGSPVTGAGTMNIDLPASGVTPTSYTSANITVDAEGRITAASNGSGGGSTTSAFQTPYFSLPNVYLTNIPAGFSTGTTFHTNNVLRVTPIVVPFTRTYTSLAVYVAGASAGAVARIGLYNLDATTGGPGTLVVDGGQINVATTGVQTAAVNVTLVPGIYFFAVVTGGATATLLGFSSPNPLMGVQLTASTETQVFQISRSFTYGPLPADESGQTYAIDSLTYNFVAAMR
jgi:hypothetical protein